MWKKYAKHNFFFFCWKWSKQFCSSAALKQTKTKTVPLWNLAGCIVWVCLLVLWAEKLFTLRDKTLQHVAVLWSPRAFLRCRIQLRRHIQSAGVFMWERLDSSVCSNEWKHWPIWQQTVRDSDRLCWTSLWALLSVTHSNLLFCCVFFSSSLPDCLFIYNGAQPSVILLSHQITSPFTAQGAGWLAAGLNECNDQALCGSHLLSSPFFKFFFSLKKKKKLPG